MKIKAKIKKLLEKSGTYRDKTSGQTEKFAATLALVDLGEDELAEVRIFQHGSREPYPAASLKVGTVYDADLLKYEAGDIVAEGSISI